MLDQAGKNAELLTRTYNQTGDILLETEDLFQQALQNYRYHSLYWLLGLVQIDHANLAGISGEAREQLIEMGLNNLATGRRIFHNDERLLAEVDVSLTMGNVENAAQRLARLVNFSPVLLTNKAIPNAMDRKLFRNPDTGGMKLDDTGKEFFRLLLPQVGPPYLDIIRAAIPVLDRGGETDLLKEYLTLEKEITRLPLGIPFWRMRVLDRPSTVEDFQRLTSEYTNLLRENPRMALISRALFLSDLQRYAPPGVDLTEWRDQVMILAGESEGRIAGILSLQMLAQDAFTAGTSSTSPLACWQYLLKAYATTSLSTYDTVQGRRPGTLDANLWGITLPLMSN
jgi:hypothetical protein